LPNETERKFLVKDSPIRPEISGTSIVQGYLSGPSDDLSIRIRLVPEIGFLAIKGPRHGAVRMEMECEIPREMADLLIGTCRENVVAKMRYPIFYAEQMWVVDVFQDANEGLILAEIELTREDELFEIPHWCGEEVTYDDRYYNPYLSVNPYSDWTSN
jgi:adenylate cyclase